MFNALTPTQETGSHKLKKYKFFAHLSAWRLIVAPIKSIRLYIIHKHVLN